MQPQDTLLDLDRRGHLDRNVVPLLLKNMLVLPVKTFLHFQVCCLSNFSCAHFISVLPKSVCYRVGPQVKTFLILWLQ